MGIADAQQRLVGFEQLGLVEAHRCGEAAEPLGVRDALADGCDGGLVPAEPQMPPRRHDVGLFELGGGREDDIGVAGGVGHELLADDAEQVVTFEAPPDQIRRAAP